MRRQADRLHVERRDVLRFGRIAGVDRIIRPSPRKILDYLLLNCYMSEDRGYSSEHLPFDGVTLVQGAI